MDELNRLVQKYQTKHGTDSLQYRELPDGRLILNARKEQTVLKGISIDMAIVYLSTL